MHSQEDVSLAGALMRALRGVIALTATDERRVFPTAADVVAGCSPEAVAPIALVRLLQFSILPEILGESAGPAIYLAAKSCSRELEIASLDELKQWFARLGIGELEVELDDQRVLVKLRRMRGVQMPAATGTPVCDFERGLIDGALEGITGSEVTTRETMCWSLGDTVCQLEGYAGHQRDSHYDDGFRSDEQRRLLGLIADQAEVALDNLRLLEEQRKSEASDPLTGLMNFRMLRERAVFELARAQRHGQSAAFTFVDLDGFAEVNRQAGREAGDEVLRHWAAAFSAELRSCDLVCRYGADEFLLVMPETTDRQAAVALQRVFGVMRRLAVETAERPLELTATAGVACFPGDGGNLEELVVKAATTAYRARSGGSSKVAFASGFESD